MSSVVVIDQKTGKRSGTIDNVMYKLNCGDCKKGIFRCSPDNPLCDDCYKPDGNEITYDAEEAKKGVDVLSVADKQKLKDELFGDIDNAVKGISNKPTVHNSIYGPKSQIQINQNRIELPSELFSTVWYVLRPKEWTKEQRLEALDVYISVLHEVRKCVTSAT